MDNRDLIINKKKNARLYPVFKMFSCNLLFYYAIAFIFLVYVKNFTPSQVMFTDALLPAFKILLNIPSTIIVDKIGKRNSEQEHSTKNSEHTMGS